MSQWHRGKRILLDGDRITPGTEGCTCGHACPFPCWMRLGLAPACSACGCAPFPDDPGELPDAA